MYRSSYNQRDRSCDHLVRCNFAIVIALTISSTALTTYILNSIVNSPYKKANNDTKHSFPIITKSQLARLPVSSDFADDITPESSEFIPSRHANNLRTTSSATWPNIRLHHKGLTGSNQSKNVNGNSEMFGQVFNNSLILPKEWQPIVESSESVATEIESNILLNEGMKKFKQRLSTMSKSELLKLLKIVQDRIDKSVLSLKKRNVDKPLVGEPTKIVVKIKKSGENVVTRSEKMKQLMENLEKIESNVPQLDTNKLNKLTMSDNEKSVVRIVKPVLIEAVTKKPDLPKPKHEDTALNSGITSWRKELIASLQPVEQGWPQQQEVVEDWPTVQPSIRPKKKKKKKRITTTTTTTQTPVIVETSTFIPPSSPAPFEEVWIEEEEDIVRPPRRKLKKYKKKTSQAPETTTTSTSTTTTTTSAPTTTAAPDVVTEDWPNDELWPQSTSKAPNLWPEKQEIPEQQGKWPEEEWLNAVRDHVQNQYNILYL